MKKRGALARRLDLQTVKLNLMHEYDTYSEEMVAREDAKMRALKVKLSSSASAASKPRPHS